MQAPKRKKSRARTRMRKAHWRLSSPSYSSCPHCRRPKLPHRVCANCGWYAGREAVSVE